MTTEISYVTATVIPLSMNVCGIGDAVVPASEFSVRLDCGIGDAVEFSVRLDCGREDDQKNDIPSLLPEVRLDFLASDDETE